MNRDFKLKFDEMRESDPGGNDASQKQFFDSPGHVRNLCFVWPDGKMKFLNYAYLVSGEYSANESIIILSFTSENFLIKGSNLEGLFLALLNHLPKKITYTDPRYTILEDSDLQITEIKVIKES